MKYIETDGGAVTAASVPSVAMGDEQSLRD